MSAYLVTLTVNKIEKEKEFTVHAEWPLCQTFGLLLCSTHFISSAQHQRAM